MTDKEVSDLSLSRKECPKCGAVWINGQHIWSGTGNKTENSELDLAGLVCNRAGDDTCINPQRGVVGGITWEERASEAERMVRQALDGAGDGQL